MSTIKLAGISTSEHFLRMRRRAAAKPPNPSHFTLNALQPLSCQTAQETLHCADLTLTIQERETAHTSPTLLISTRSTIVRMSTMSTCAADSTAHTSFKCCNLRWVSSTARITDWIKAQRCVHCYKVKQHMFILQGAFTLCLDLHRKWCHTGLII